MKDHVKTSGRMQLCIGKKGLQNSKRIFILMETRHPKEQGVSCRCRTAPGPEFVFGYEKGRGLHDLPDLFRIGDDTLVDPFSSLFFTDEQVGIDRAVG